MLGKTPWALGLLLMMTTGMLVIRMTVMSLIILELELGITAATTTDNRQQATCN